MNKIFCATQFGLGIQIVEVEVSFIRALPSFVISGLASSAIQESKQRIQASLSTLDFIFPPLKVNVNLSPSDLPKQGSHFDLPIALLVAMHKNSSQTRHEWFAFGELGLDGKIKHNTSLFSLVLNTLLHSPRACMILPKQSEEFFSSIPNLQAYYADTLKEAYKILKEDIPPNRQNKPLSFPFVEIQGEKYFYREHFENDFKDVKNQKLAKRAALICAAGFHNIILEGSPGSGKSMIIQRLWEILPPVSLFEMIEMTKIRSYSGESLSLVPIRSFKSPHQSASKSSIIGSVFHREPRPGEIALSHLGILFLDELPFFAKDVLEALREPLENNRLLVSRVSNKIEYETSFLFAGAQNPCPCGNLLSTIKECRCTDAEIHRYKNRLSEPFLDRIDIFVQMSEVDGVVHKKIDDDLNSKNMRDLVFKAFAMQKNRKQKKFNGKLTQKEIEVFCNLDLESEQILQRGIDNLGFSMRLVDKVRKVARTIADIEGSVDIKKSHVLEAISYRKISSSLC